MRRVAPLVLGLFYLLQASWLLQGGVDLLFPRYRMVKPSESACCTGDCGCSEHAKAQKSCCCYPGPKASDSVAKDGPVRVRLSTLEEARCKGPAAAAEENVSHPALHERIGLAREIFVLLRVEEIPLRHALFLIHAPPEKVPI